MKAKLNSQEIIERNRLVDVEQLQEVLDVASRLAQSGVVEAAGYNLDLPYEKRVTRQEDAAGEGATSAIRLQR